MEILGKYGKDDLAILYVAKINGKVVEFVESIQPPLSREEKWVLIISTLYGCPMQCLMCDAGEYYQGKVSKDAMLAQIEHMVLPRFPDRSIPIPKLKIQFARMGEPSLNSDVLKFLKELPVTYDVPGLIPCISTVAPKGTEAFFEELFEIKNSLYANGFFQLQFSIHSTDVEERRKWIPKSIWNFEQIAQFGKKWLLPGDRKITLNFAVGETSIIDPQVIRKYFDPSQFFIKLTPVNPTYNAVRNNLKSGIKESNSHDFQLAKDFRDLGYETLVSIGEWEENQIGSNCGQFATQFLDGEVKLKETYTCQEYRLTS
ncbi:hypothetical protein NEF87_004968 [Candidatus Lokiarchaeum ossiferum]|uniref:Radical SAM protein n=1 Tax=Candidatus Lokiarchaeum ossiferum TaxID=2951803 RepID=A0ABY6HYS3_9ARCH|nr:hypothetical protein NEF87_004968 [Candidatus Lokiarchaeum sp. B-35]